MFGRGKRKFRAPKISTVVGSGTEVRGDIQFSSGLHVDGVIKGDVISDPEDRFATLTLSELGKIEGNVRVANVMLNGTVVGDVVAAHRVELAPKAKITGTLTYALLEMSMGAEVNGKLIHAEQEPRKLEYDGNRQQAQAASAQAQTQNQNQGQTQAQSQGQSQTQNQVQAQSQTKNQAQTAAKPAPKPKAAKTPGNGAE